MYILLVIKYLRAPAHNIPEEYGDWTSEDLTNAVANGTIDMKTSKFLHIV